MDSCIVWHPWEKARCDPRSIWTSRSTEKCLAATMNWSCQNKHCAGKIVALSQVLVGEQERTLGYGDSHEGEQIAARDITASSGRCKSAEEFVALVTHHSWETLLLRAS